MFNGLMWDMCFSNGLNLSWNVGQMSCMANSMLFNQSLFTGGGFGYGYPQMDLQGSFYPQLFAQAAINQTNAAFGMPGNYSFNLGCGGGSGTTGGSGLSNDASTADKNKYKELKEKLNEIAGLVSDKELMEADGMEDLQNLKDEIKDALNMKDATDAEKIEALENVYKNVPADVIQRAIYKKHYSSELAKMGFDMSVLGAEEKLNEKDNVSSLVSNIHSSISSKDYESSALSAVSDSNVAPLRLFSAWNRVNYSNDGNIIKYIANNYPSSSSSDKDLKVGQARTAALAVANALLAEATKITGNGKSLDKLQEAKGNMEEIIRSLDSNDNCSKEKLEELAEAFDDLYSIVRIEKAMIIDNKIGTKYKKLEDVCDKNLYGSVAERTRKDLEEREGLGSDAANVTVDDITKVRTTSSSTDEDSYDNGNANKSQAQKTIDSLVKEGALKQSFSGAYVPIYGPTHYYRVDNGKIYEYSSSLPTGSKTECSASDLKKYSKMAKKIKELKDLIMPVSNNLDGALKNKIFCSKQLDVDNKYVYYVFDKDGNLKKVKNVSERKNNSLRINGNLVAIKDIIDNPEKYDLASVDKLDIPTKENIKKKQKENAKSIGKSIYNQVSGGGTSSSNYTYVREKLEALNADTVYGVLDGWYEASKNHNITKFLDEEDDGANPIGRKAKVNLVKSVIAAAKNAGLEVGAISNLETELKKFDKRPNAQNFRYTGWDRCTNIFGRDDMADRIGDNIKEIYDALKEKETTN